MTPTYPRKRSQRRSEIPHGPQQTTGLQQIRDTLPPAPEPRTVEPAPRPAGQEVPPELLALVAHHCRRINAYLARAQHLQTLHGDDMRQWQRLVLYALTDVFAHNYLLVGTLAAYLQRQDLPQICCAATCNPRTPTATSPARQSSTSTASPAPCPRKRPSLSGPASADGSPATTVDGHTVLAAKRRRRNAGPALAWRGRAAESG